MMNLLHLRYVVETAEAGSLHKAAEALYTAPSALSRAIRELEASLGIVIFDRSAKGMHVTPDGALFLRYAKTILRQVDEMEEMFAPEAEKRERFAVVVPRSVYISEVFARFTEELADAERIDMFYKETTSMDAVRCVVEGDYKMGIIRYEERYEKFYRELLTDQGLERRLIAQSPCVAVFGEKSPLAQKERLLREDLAACTEVLRGDPNLPAMPEAQANLGTDRISQRQIYIFDRSTQMEILAANPDTYLLGTPVPEQTLARYGLVQRRCEDYAPVYLDELIFREGYQMSEAEAAFVKRLSGYRKEMLARGADR
ncbi:MAG: LysR family transcriptional regulator [Lachnospiraceae bacterium]|nr:LysR family transcriptional regulator [Lachnospiraceae bacterium]